MGATLKYIIPIVLIALGLFAFQNCDERALQANGDPYENQDIQLDDGYLDSPDIGADPTAGAQPRIPGFQAEQHCQRQNPEAHIYALQLGTYRSNDSVAVQLADGRYKIFAWPSGTSPLVINESITSQLTVVSVELINNGSQSIVQYQHNGSLASETLNCQ